LRSATNVDYVRIFRYGVSSPDASAAAKLEPGASLGGFSPDGVTMASTGARPSAAQSAVAVGGGIGTLAVAGGGGGELTPAPVPSTPSGESSLTGRWTGTAGNGAGLLIRITGSSVACTLGYDMTADLTQSGASVTGPLTVVLQVVSCQPPEADTIARPYQGTVGSGALSATISPPGGIGFTVGSLVFAGSFTANSIEVTATLPDPSFTVVYTLRLVRR
jgi:hypothetical protein